MEIRDYAETILFSRTLEGKLVDLGKLTDDKPGKALDLVESPARPEGLGFSSVGDKKIAFPKLTEMDDENTRGRILHYFANHELLALELMALTVLRFPDAPKDFRKMIAVTMRDEQRHMSLYLDRMADLGVELGEIPLSPFFWKLIADMQTPMDFVTRMSLTFEQANLDYSLFYRDAFKTVGDKVSAEIMQEVLVDEVAHVRHGVHFFEEWREPEVSMWEAYKANLTFPLSPVRAKGIGFTAELRLEAGLDQDFIDRLKVYSHSKGRSPRVYLFNPATEDALGRLAPSHTPPAAVLGLAKDLETLPMFLASPEDMVLVREEPDPAFLSDLMDLGYGVPEFAYLDLDGRQIPGDSPLLERKIAALQPWGWDPTIARFLAPLRSCVTEQEGDLQEIPRAQRHLASKAWLAEKLPGILELLPDAFRAQCITEDLPAVAMTLEEVQSRWAEYRRDGADEVVVKAPFGTSGRETQRISSKGLLPNQIAWVENTLSVLGCVVIEPWYHRRLDLSYQFKVNSDGSCSERGLTRFFTDSRGRYRGTLLAPISVGLPEDVHHHLFRSTPNAAWVSLVSRQIMDALIADMAEVGFSGPAGIDMMVVEDASGELKLRVPLELNPRPTMGHVALSIGRMLANESKGLWLFVNRKELASTGCVSFSALLSRLQEELPTRLGPDGPRTRQAVFPTNDPTKAQHVLSLCLVSTELETLLAALQEVGLSSPMGSG